MSNYSSNLVILFPLAVSLFVAIRIGEGMIGGSRNGWARSIVYTLIGLMVALSLTGLLIRIGWISLVWLVGLAVIITIISIRSRALNRSAMYQSFVAADCDQNRQAMALDFITHNTGIVRYRAQVFLQSLALLSNWAKALEQSKIALNPHEKLACRTRLRFGDDVDQVLTPLLQSSRVQQEAERLLARLYPIPLAVVGFIVLGLVMWRIIPTLDEIRQEFGMEVSNNLQSLFDFSDWLVNEYWWILFLILLLAVMVVCAFNVIAWVFPFLTQHYPLRIITQSYYRSFGLLSLSIAMRHQSDASAACQSASEMMPVSFISKRLKRAGQLIQQGQQPAIALYKASLINKRQSSLLTGSEKLQSFAWTIESASLSVAEQTLRLHAILTQILVVASTLILALLYGYVAQAFIEFLTQMILETARTIK